MVKTHESLLCVSMSSVIQEMAVIMPKPEGTSTHLGYKVEFDTEIVREGGSTTQSYPPLQCEFETRLGYEILIPQKQKQTKQNLDSTQ